jgi:hypothetical protein
MINKVPSIPYPNILISSDSDAKAAESMMLLFIKDLFDLANLLLNCADDLFILAFGF